jgi:hypothetical protein
VSWYDAAALDGRVEMQQRYVRVLEACGASPALLAAVDLLDGILAERNALVRREWATSLSARR